MLPTYKNGAVIVVSNLLKPKVGSIVVATIASQEVVKRVRSITTSSKYYLVGDNHAQSIDSREYGPVSRSAIKGVVLHLKRR